MKVEDDVNMIYTIPLHEKMENKTKEQLIQLCKDSNISGYSGKTKSQLLEILNKKLRGQFYTTRYEYILDGLTKPPVDGRVIEPFAGKGDLLKWIESKEVDPYDIEPKSAGISQRDTLLNPPDYKDSWVVTNPPYLARNKCKDKDLFEKYQTNDLFKCFIYSMIGCKGGVIIIPASFFLSPRDVDFRCRDTFMSRYRITKIKYFEEAVFEDTPTTVVAFSFELSDVELDKQEIEWVFMPSGEKKVFHMNREENWIVSGSIYQLSTPDKIKIRRHVEGEPLRNGEQQTFMTLNALDTGAQNGRISLEYKKDYVYPAKECSRSYATLRITGKVLSEEEQKTLCELFNTFIERKRVETKSLFLPQYRESKEYARKRIPFELAYTILLHLIQGK
jgi:hypothetical protein